MKINRRSFIKKTAALPVAASLSCSLVFRNLVNATGGSSGGSYSTSDFCPYFPVKTGKYWVYEKKITINFLDQMDEKAAISAFAATLQNMTDDQRHSALIDDGYHIKAGSPHDLWEEACLGVTRPATPAERIEVYAEFPIGLAAQAGPPALPAHSFMDGNAPNEADTLREWRAGEHPGWPAEFPGTYPNESWYWDTNDKTKLTFAPLINVVERTLIAMDCVDVLFPEPPLT